MSKQQSLYRHFNKAGELLYIGVSCRILQRVKEHSKHSHWWLEIARIEIEHFKDRAEVLEAEREAIKNEKPKYNIQLRGRGFVSDQKVAVQTAKETLIARVLALKPLYKLPEVPDAIGAPPSLIRAEINAGRLGFIDVPSAKSGKLVRYVSGYHILDWIECYSTQAKGLTA